MAVIGTHDGYPFFTVGQRRGLGLSAGSALYVNRIDPKTNVVYVGGEEELDKRVVYINGVNLIKSDPIIDGTECIAKIRHLDKGSHPRLYNADGGRLKIEFLKNAKAATLGQSAVLVDYDGDLLAGGIICEVR